MKTKYKVVIIGCGPSGISTALNLINNGINDILIIEKYKIPRYKCCAGYITSKTKREYEKLGLKFGLCNYSLIKDFNIYYKLKMRQNIKNKFLFTNKNIDRVELDFNFYKILRNKGVKVFDGVTIKKHQVNKNNVILSNGYKVFYDCLVFADGSCGYSEKYKKEKAKNIAMQVVFPYEMPNKIDIHFGITKNGYAWVSSYNNIVNVGFTDVFDKNVNYNDKMKEFLTSLKLPYFKENLRGAFTPIGIKNGVINNNVFLVGDAVGACDPLTLSGLRYALTTGRYVSLAIKNKNNKIYEKFLKKLKFKFLFMRFLQKIFYLKITLFCVFNIGCTIFKKVISFAFNNFFVNKK